VPFSTKTEDLVGKIEMILKELLCFVLVKEAVNVIRMRWAIVHIEFVEVEVEIDVDVDVEVEVEIEVEIDVDVDVEVEVEVEVEIEVEIEGELPVVPLKLKQCAIEPFLHVTNGVRVLRPI
jgi:hypothetical protein